jgi:hypothetical protein
MRHKTANSATIYIQEELSNARRHCDTVKRGISQALDLINASDKQDHFYAVAGDLIYSVPAALMQLEKSLNTVALAVDKLDYEEIRQVLRPDRVDELERVLEEVRIRLPRRTGR